MRALITGSKGFIGRYLVRAAREIDYEVVECDIDIPPTPQDYDVIYHLAALSRVKDCEANPMRAVLCNIGALVEMIEFAKTHARSFVYVATQETGDNIYGLTKRFAETYTKRVCTELPLAIVRPPHVYGPGDNPDKIIPRLIRGDIERLNDNRIFLAHVANVAQAILHAAGKNTEFNIPGFGVSIFELEKFIRYVADSNS